MPLLREATAWHAQPSKTARLDAGSSGTCSALRAGTPSSSLDGSDWISWHASDLIQGRKTWAGTSPGEVTASSCTRPTARATLYSSALPASLCRQCSATAHGGLVTGQPRPSRSMARLSCPAVTQEDGLRHPSGGHWPLQTTALRSSTGWGEAVLAVRHASPTQFPQEGTPAWGENHGWNHLLEVDPKGVSSLKVPASNLYCCLGFLP